MTIFLGISQQNELLHFLFKQVFKLVLHSYHFQNPLSPKIEYIFGFGRWVAGGQLCHPKFLHHIRGQFWRKGLSTMNQWTIELGFLAYDTQNLVFASDCTSPHHQIRYMLVLYVFRFYVSGNVCLINFSNLFNAF